MVSGYPLESLVEAVLEQYGILVPLELAYAYYEAEPDIIPETLYYYEMSLNEE